MNAPTLFNVLAVLALLVALLAPVALSRDAFAAGRGTTPGAGQWGLGADKPGQDKPGQDEPVHSEPKQTGQGEAPSADGDQDEDEEDEDEEEEEGDGDGDEEDDPNNPQVDAQVDKTASCAVRNADGSVTVSGQVTVTNQAEHSQDIRILNAEDAVSGKVGGSDTNLANLGVDTEGFEALFEGQVILQGQALTRSYSFTFNAGEYREFANAFSVTFESVQTGADAFTPRSDREDFVLCKQAAPSASPSPSPSPEPSPAPSESPEPSPSASPDPEANNPQVDAEINKTASCATRNADGSVTVRGRISILNQSEHDQAIRILNAEDTVYGKFGGSDTDLRSITNVDGVEALFEGRVIAYGATISEEYFVTFNPASYEEFANEFVITFESADTGVDAFEPRSDREDFVLCDEAAPSASPSPSPVPASPSPSPSPSPQPQPEEEEEPSPSPSPKPEDETPSPQPSEQPESQPQPSEQPESQPQPDEQDEDAPAPNPGDEQEDQQQEDQQQVYIQPKGVVQPVQQVVPIQQQQEQELPTTLPTTGGGALSGASGGVPIGMLAYYASVLAVAGGLLKRRRQ